MTKSIVIQNEMFMKSHLCLQFEIVQIANINPYLWALGSNIEFLDIMGSAILKQQITSAFTDIYLLHSVGPKIIVGKFK